MKGYTQKLKSFSTNRNESGKGWTKERSCNSNEITHYEKWQWCQHPSHRVIMYQWCIEWCYFQHPFHRFKLYPLYVEWCYCQHPSQRGTLFQWHVELVFLDGLRLPSPSAHCLCNLYTWDLKRKRQGDLQAHPLRFWQ